MGGVNNPGQPDPEVRRLLEELVASQKRTDRWMIALTVVIAIVSALMLFLTGVLLVVGGPSGID